MRSSASPEKLVDLPTLAEPSLGVDNADVSDWCVGVKWISTADREHGVFRNHARRGTVEQIRRPELVEELLKHFAKPPTE